MSKFINPFTDWGFKHIFGKKEFLINFLNSLFEGEHVITDIRYLNNERLPEQIGMRKVIYDIFCETESGEHIIVEMQLVNRILDILYRTGLCSICRNRLLARA